MAAIKLCFTFNKSCQIFNMQLVLRRNAQRVAGPIIVAERLGNTAPQKRRSGDEPLGHTVVDLTQDQTSRADSDVFHHYANQSVY